MFRASSRRWVVRRPRRARLRSVFEDGMLGAWSESRPSCRRDFDQHRDLGKDTQSMAAWPGPWTFWLLGGGEW